jgi:SAM-dependent methyltransferase
MSDKGFEAAEIKDIVRARYGGIASSADSGCCAPPASCCAITAASAVNGEGQEMAYSAEELAAVPEGANLGLGSGAGFDRFLAARQVGATGHVIGVDMTHEKLKKARDNAARVGAANIQFRLGELEHLQITDKTAEVILSNCVINLVPDKEQVFREAFRVLRAGGRLAISDVVNLKPLSADLTADRALVCGCVGGAAPVRDVKARLQAAGFEDVQVTVKSERCDLVASWAPGRGIEDYVASAIIEARKPGTLHNAIEGQVS